jgi:hypothetical protein
MTYSGYDVEYLHVERNMGRTCSGYRLYSCLSTTKIGVLLNNVCY